MPDYVREQHFEFPLERVFAFFRRPANLVAVAPPEMNLRVVDGPEVVETFVKELGLTFDILHDQTADVQRLYQTTGVPESFLIDRDGVIIKKVIGAIEWDNPVNTVLVRRLLDAR